jgi:hypothetical protein
MQSQIRRSRTNIYERVGSRPILPGRRRKRTIRAAQMQTRERKVASAIIPPPALAAGPVRNDAFPTPPVTLQSPVPETETLVRPGCAATDSTVVPGVVVPTVTVPGGGTLQLLPFVAAQRSATVPANPPVDLTVTKYPADGVDGFIADKAIA